MTTWIYNEKFLTDIRFLIRTLSFTTREDNDLEHLTQEQEERRTMTIYFEFHRGIKKSMTMFQAIIRQPATTNSIDGSAQPPIGTTSMTTRSSELAFSEI
jgi:hypothetical protein